MMLDKQDYNETETEEDDLEDYDGDEYRTYIPNREFRTKQKRNDY